MDNRLGREQGQFFDYLLDRSSDALSIIVDDARVGAKKRMGIYHYAYRASLSGVLSDNHERLARYMGPHFDDAAQAYIAEYPSTTRNLRYYGDGFADFLAQKYPDNPELGELARLDWRLRHAFDAEDAVPLDAARIGELGDAWIEMPLRLHPAASIIHVKHNIVALWTPLSKEEYVPPLERLPAPMPILIWRQDYQPSFRSITADEATALSLLHSPMSFTMLSEQMIARLGEDQVAISLGTWLGRWLAEGLLVPAS